MSDGRRRRTDAFAPLQITRPSAETRSLVAALVASSSVSSARPPVSRSSTIASAKLPPRGRARARRPQMP